jgi:hypothetical protein
MQKSNKSNKHESLPRTLYSHPSRNSSNSIAMNAAIINAVAAYQRPISHQELETIIEQHKRACVQSPADVISHLLQSTQLYGFKSHVVVVVVRVGLLDSPDVSSACKHIESLASSVYWIPKARVPTTSPNSSNKVRQALLHSSPRNRSLPSLHKRTHINSPTPPLKATTAVSDGGAPDSVEALKKAAQIDRLHRYNDVKDAGQVLLGRLAVIEGVATRAMYAKYELHLDD